MAAIGDLFQSVDWKSEKHVPVIECPESVAADEMFEVKLSIYCNIHGLWESSREISVG